MKRLIYIPQPDITLYELAQVLKVFTYGTLPMQLKTDEILFKIYDTLTPQAKRHFRVDDLGDKPIK